MVKDPALDMREVYALGEVKKQIEPPHNLFVAEEGWRWKNWFWTVAKQNKQTTKKNTTQKDAGDDTAITSSLTGYQVGGKKQKLQSNNTKCQKANT